MSRRMPNASMAQATWGGIQGPPQPVRESMPHLKQYPIEQVLYFHERHLQELMGAVGQLQFDASKNTTSQTASVDVEAIKESVKAELSTQFAAQNKKIEKQQKTIASLRQEIVDLRTNLEENVELIVDEQ
jgi:peptide subunit release factor RF-3